MNLSLRPRSLEPERPSQAMQEAALARAMEAARDPLNVLNSEPWSYYRLDEEEVSAVVWLYARLLEEEMSPQEARAAHEQWRAIPGWVVVTCIRLEDEAEMERAVEDCLTSVQRATLSLWSDNVPNNWVTDMIAEDPELYTLVGIDAAKEKVLGIMWYGHPERG